MDFSSLPLFAALSRKMNWLAERQKVLAENIANVDTQHYRAMDLRPLDFSRELSSAQAKLQPVSTSGMDLAAPDSNEIPANQLIKEPGDADISGNTVSLEDEMIKVSKTSADYQLMTNLYKKQIGLIKEALGKGSSS